MNSTAILARLRGSPKCEGCGTRGTTKLVSSEIIKQERAYGIVVRSEAFTRKRSYGQNGVMREYTSQRREERAPIIRTITRFNFSCSTCNRSSFKDNMVQTEDFTRGPEQLEPTVIFQKEIVKMPCRYCGALNENTSRSCSGCGAALR